MDLAINIAARVKPLNKPTDTLIITLNGTEIRVPAVDAVRALVGPALNAPAAGAPAQRLKDLQQLDRVTIGSQGVHGIYAGVARADETIGDHVVEVIEEAKDSITWDEAMKWAESLGGTLPTRKEQALLFANVPELFEKEWYWSCEPNASDPSCAWCQYFGYGAQNDDRKGDRLRARAVRRLAI